MGELHSPVYPYIGKSVNQFFSIHFHSVSLSRSISNHPIQTSLALVWTPLLSLRAGGEKQKKATHGIAFYIVFRDN
jgi:hypothetical protein